MKLSYLLEKISYECIKGSSNIEITSLVYYSGKVKKGSAFVCIKGMEKDGHEFVEEAINRGAVAIIVEKEIQLEKEVTIIKTVNTRTALAYMSAAYFLYPSRELKLIGVTGTKGKTTTTYMISSILNKAGLKTGLIGTVEIIVGEKIIRTENTTPESYLIHETLRNMVSQGCKAVVMEVSSQALMLNRTEGLLFDYAVFTNIKPDHISKKEHKDFDEYISCKAKLFKQCIHASVNMDDKNVGKILNGKTCFVEGFGLKETEIYAKDISLYGELGIKYNLYGKERGEIILNLPGKFNVYNSLAAISVCRCFNVSMSNIKEALLNIRVKGRTEIVEVSDKYSILIDYAHNAVSLESLLTTLREYKPKRLICLFGCGGNRSKQRRYEMGEVSGLLADLTVVTSDNPRDEEPMEIIKDITVGLEKVFGEYIVISDRKEAIKYCIKNEQQGDMIVLAGKGHEDYQEIKGIKYKMDEREIINSIVSNITEKIETKPDDKAFM